MRARLVLGCPCRKLGLVGLLRTERPDLSRLTFIFLGLAISVFAWGLQYKLSLYDPPHSTAHQMPEAKLLSRNEQATAGESLLLESTTASAVIGQPLLFNVFAFSLLAFNLLRAPISTQSEQEVDRPRRISCRPCLTAFFFRPPPFLV